MRREWVPYGWLHYYGDKLGNRALQSDCCIQTSYTLNEKGVSTEPYEPPPPPPNHFNLPLNIVDMLFFSFLHSSMSPALSRSLEVFKQHSVDAPFPETAEEKREAEDKISNMTMSTNRRSSFLYLSDVEDDQPVSASSSRPLSRISSVGRYVRMLSEHEITELVSHFVMLVCIQLAIGISIFSVSCLIFLVGHFGEMHRKWPVTSCYFNLCVNRTYVHVCICSPELIMVTGQNPVKIDKCPTKSPISGQMLNVFSSTYVRTLFSGCHLTYSTRQNNLSELARRVQ